MKNKKAFSLLLGLSLALPYPVVAAYAADNVSEDEIQEEIVSVEQPTAPEPPAPPETDDDQPYLYASTDYFSTALPNIHPEIELPPKYDLRKLGLVSSIKNQGDLGTCWAHALLGSIETDLISDYPDIDLSERYLATLIVSKEYGDGSESFEEGSDARTAFGLLTNQIGAVSENVAPYNDEYTIDRPRDGLKEQTEFLVTDVQAFRFFANNVDDLDTEQYKTNLRAVKEAIYSGHAAYITMDFDEDNMVDHGTKALFNNFDPYAEREHGHAVTIVGYDDNYSAENFLIRPPYDGAWLIKNSWGLNRGDYGYYWVSYWDDTFNKVYTVDAVPVPSYDHLYSNDDFGTSGTFSADEDGDNDIFISNEYKAEESGFITDIMMNCAVPNDNYKITVYTGLSDPTNPISGEPHECGSGVMEHVGYQTIKLSQPVHINEGERFAVVVEISGEKGYHVACESSFDTMKDNVAYSQWGSESVDSENIISEERILDTFNSGQSFFSTDGQNWNDLYNLYLTSQNYNGFTGNLCLRALVSNEGKIQFSSYNNALPPGTDITLSSADGSDIFYSVDGGEYQKYTAPIKFSGEMTLSAYAEGYEDDVYTHHYDEKCAGASSILITNEYDVKYADLSGETDIVLSPFESNAKLRPITTGTLRYGDNVVGSYEDLAIPCGLKPFSFTVTAEEEGLKPTEYKFNARYQYEEHFSEGFWTQSLEKGYYYFSDDGISGYHVDRISGKKEDLTYTIADNILTIKTADSVRKGYIASDSMYARILWDDNTEEHLNSFYDNGGEYKLYTIPEICSMATDYVTQTTGKAPKKVSAEFDDNNNFIITVIDDSGNKKIYETYAETAIAKDENGNIFDFKKVPVDTGVKSFTPGIWSVSSSYLYPDVLCYYYFAPNGKDGKFIDLTDGRISDFTFSLNDGQFRMYYDYDNDMFNSAAAEVYKDSATLKYQAGGTNYLEYVQAIDIDDFRFINNNDLKTLASEYYEAYNCAIAKFDRIEQIDSSTVAIYMANGCDEECSMIGYQVDRFTGKGVDQDGNKIDLYAPVERSDTHFRKGIWKCIDTEYNSLIGYYWFDDKGETSVFADIFNGYRYNIQYRILNSQGIISEDGQKQMIGCNETKDGYELIYTDAKGYQTSRTLIFVKEAEKDELKFYNAIDLGAMAVNDYQMKNSPSAPVVIGASGIDENGNIRFHLTNPKTCEEYGVYTIDSMTGKGTDINGEAVDLPQTGLNSPANLLTMISAFIMSVFGIFSVKRSGILRLRKKEE